MTIRSARDIPSIPKEATPDQVINGTNDLIDSHNFLLKNISFEVNFNGQIIENITFAAGETKTISHGLGMKPKYRVILRQEGNGVLDDIPSGWNNFSIQMRNNGAVSVTATIMLVRE